MLNTTSSQFNTNLPDRFFIPDPWDELSSLETITPQTIQTQSSAELTILRQLPPVHPVKLLLEDELKLSNKVEQPLWTNIQTLLTWIYWLNWESNGKHFAT
jgi:hypothetical protein